MKKIITFLVAGLVLMAASTVNAMLTDNGDGTVTDDDRGDGTSLMWLQTPAADMSWGDARAWADSLVFAGYNDWRLPSALDFGTGDPDTGWNSTNNEFGHLYGDELGNPANSGDQGPLPDYGPLYYWTDTAGGPGEAYAFFWSWDGLYMNDLADVSAVINVTAVRHGDGPIPAPVADAGGPYSIALGDPPITLAGSVVGDYTEAAWDLDSDGLYDDVFGLDPVISTDMLTSLGFSPGMTWDIGLQATGPGGVDVSMTELTFVPVPGAVLLGMIGLSVVGIKLRKRA